VFWEIFGSAETPMVMVDDSRRYVAVNQSACDLLGMSREELLSLRIDDLMASDAREGLPARWRRFLLHGTTAGDFRLVLPGGRQVKVEFSAVANVMPGSHLAIFVTTRELTRDDPDAPALTPREREVLGLVAQGQTSAEIADRLGISPNTVDVHTANILGKLRARTRAHAIALALEHGQISLPSD
jgi:PAS domain S-box-containing protein